MTTNKKAQPTISTPNKETKISKVVRLLQRKQGATLDEMIKATGWQGHTVRAALTGLKKKGYTIERELRGEMTCWKATSGKST